MSAPRISALVVARNEAARLPACLACLREADELVVVLDRSTDASAEIARAAGALVVEGAWELEGGRRNAGIAACSGDWILEVDADELVPPALWAAIRRVVATSPHSFHRVRIDNYVGDRLVRYGWDGGMGTTLKPILFRKGAKHWRAQRVHPGLDFSGSEGGRLSEAGIRHMLDADISDMLRRLDSYSSAKARDLLAMGKVGSLPEALRRALFRAVKSYVRRQGYREGAMGVLLACCCGMFPLLSHIKARLEPQKYGPEYGPGMLPPGAAPPRGDMRDGIATVASIGLAAEPIDEAAGSADPVAGPRDGAVSPGSGRRLAETQGDGTSPGSGRRS
jgi:Glycosyl transferase family 2